MLTDIFARRYEDVPLWENFDERARRLLVQGFRIVSEQLFPYYDEQGNKKSGAQELWDGLNKQLAMELGLVDLSPPTAYSYPTSMTHTYPTVTVCEHFVCAAFDGSVSADRFIKERLSFIKIAFRKREEAINGLNANLDREIAKGVQRVLRMHAATTHKKLSDDDRQRDISKQVQITRSVNTNTNQAFRASCDELNIRFRQAGAALDYHNGYIQVSPDELTTDQIERPFWELVSEPKWRNVDHDMKEAIDRRDNSRRDPAWYAARALESTLKIISDEKRWTHGKEKGAINYVDNLGARKNGNFINKWEGECLCTFFSNVRAPFGHGPGSDPMVELTMQQTDWAIEFCMIWIKNLIRRM